MEVIFKGWTPGLKKVSLTKLLQEEASLSLRSAKWCTDRLLAGEEVTVRVSSMAHLERLAGKAVALGVVVERRFHEAPAASR